MEAFIEHPGLSHIGKTILRNMDFKTQLTSRLVNKSWNQILQNEISKFKIDKNTLIELMLRSMICNNNDAIRKAFEGGVSNCCNWLSLVEAVFAKLDNPWINIYLLNQINKQNGGDGCETYILEYFVSKRNVKMVEFILQENLHKAMTFTFIFEDPIYNKEGLNQVLKQVINNRDTEIVEWWKPYMSIKNYKKICF